MRINATERELIKIGIDTDSALMLSTNSVRVYKSEVTNKVLNSFLLRENLVMIHKLHGDKKVFYNVPEIFLLND